MEVKKGIDIEARINHELIPALSMVPESSFDITEENIHASREASEQMVREMAALLPEDNSILVEDRLVQGLDGNPEINVRIYTPKDKDKILPGVIYFHGGGYVSGSVEFFDANCRTFVKNVNCVLVSVDYRLAPDHRFPAAVDDCYGATCWFSENASELGVDPMRIAVVGPSAGGGLTAAVCLMARDHKFPAIAFQMPLYPMLDDRFITQSSNEVLDGRIWNSIASKRAWKMYLGDAENDVSPYAAPSRETDLSNLPPAYTCVGDLDPFRDETINYVARLSQAGNAVEFHLYPGCFHGSDMMATDAEIGKRVTNEYILALRLALHGA